MTQTLFAAAPLDTTPISPQGYARLLGVTYGRFIFGIATIPFVGVMFSLWLHELGEDTHLLLGWSGVYVLAAVGIRLHRRFYLQRLKDLSDEQAVARMQLFVHCLGLIHGAGLAAGTALTIGKGTVEFTLLFYVTLAAIVAAVHQTPVLSAFMRYFLAGWGASVAMIPLTFPGHWQYVLPLSVIYSIAIYRDALVSQRFFFQQVRLEERGAHLAAQFREAKEEAEAALKAKNQFLATASHDLRQPVHAMGFLIEAISVRNRDSGLLPALRDLRSSVRSVHMMFNSLLDLSRIESGAISVARVPVAIDPLLDEVANLFREEATRRDLRLRLRVRSGQGRIVLADPILLKQSLVNLVHNAVRYTRAGGLLLAARRQGDDWSLEVWDTGVGVANDEQSRIFSPFYRNEYAWHIDSEGHGLGLAVVARCATLMNAAHGLSSRVGRGSRFWLRLPAVAIADSLLPQALLPIAETEPRQQLVGTCLIVDDDPQVASAWQNLMQAWGVHAECADCATQAFAILDRGFSPQAILCDQRLRSGESGFEVLRELFRRCPDASGAMISGEFNSPQLMQAEQEGYLVLCKPMEVERLYGLLATWLRAAA